MTDTPETTSKAPSHIAYVIRNGNTKPFFDRIGVAWQNKDGKGFNIQLHSVPVDGQLTLRLASEQK